MAHTGNDSDEYLPDSDDSNDEDERPNRWTGPLSTWQQLNSAEIDTLSALNEIRNQDLSIHLYNAFALKNRHNRRETRDVVGPVSNQDINLATGQLVQEDKWVPPNAWTAWPLCADTVPRPEFMKRADIDDEHFTYRMKIPYRPETELEETISATMLRFAKERFQARQEAAQRNEDAIESGPASGDEEDSSVEMSSVPSRARSKSKGKSGSKSRSVEYESTSEGEAMDIDDLHVEEPASSIPPETVSLKTVVATDDELSYALLRPSVQAILAKLDTTLSVLHSTQESKINCPSESEASDASSRSQSRSRSRSRGPSKMHSQSPGARRRQLLTSREPSTAREPSPPETSAGMKKRGRPKKLYPRLDGETEREYAIRIARLRKKPIPVFPDDDPEPVSDSTPVPNSAAEYTDTNAKLKPRERRARAPRRRGSEALSDVTSANETRRELSQRPRLARVRLRDWRDILGAAALVGFPAQALDRATRRCADLFGQSFTLHTLQEGPPDRKRLDKSVRYDPGMAIPSFPEDSEDSDDEAPSQRSRTASMAPSESEGQGRGRGRSPSTAPQSKSRSRSASASGVFFCMFDACPRTVKPFDRHYNLIRHLRLIHGYDGDKLSIDVDSQDEMHGAVHVDGFLKPIKIRAGWRGDDAAKEKRRPRRYVRDVEVRMRDADSTTGYEESD
ncbi:RNA polymerase I-specific transcription initiation factor-domain-containing protein [Xylaria digitata]|nr:RNA polymerase I-specific transcription initiation factor-domain-containing protein [Xylaria digitata]